MVAVVRLMGWLIVLAGVLFTIKPQALKSYMEFWRPAKRIYLGGVVALLLGIVLLMASAGCKWGIVIAAVGALSLIKGVLLFVVGLEKVRAVLDWYAKKSDKFIRIMGVIDATLGILILYSI
ncbi:MAG: hypothetical protein JSW17_00320 [Candidatus Omnitrophota bacterium]|nr:MAG: hypothetical protein JSW17_00320 [Candidatus Omnitrophota bacterium]